MRQLWSRMTWGLTLACALALCTGSAQAINTNPYEQYPVRTTIGIVALILAIALALFAILRSWIKAGIRRRSYGADMRYGTPMPSHKMAKKGRKRYGKNLRLPIHFTNYRGRKKNPASVGIPVPAELHRHRKITGRKSRYGSKLVAVSTQRYTGGASHATSARFVHTDPLSHKGSRRSKRRFGVPSLPVKQAAYKGGGSVAKPARFESTMPLSHRGRAKASKYYGGKMFAKPVTSYKGGGSVAKPARFESTMPLSHRGRAKASKYYGGKMFAKPVTSYKGGGSVAKPARFESTMPLSHRGRAKASKYYGGKLHAKPVTSYKGGGSVAKPARFESTMPLSHRGRAKASKYYGGKMFAKPVTSYKGGGSVAKPARFESTMPLSHRGRAKASKYYGGKMFAKPVTSYKGGESVAKPAKFGLAAPKVHHGNKAEKRSRTAVVLAIEDYTGYKGKHRTVPGEDPVIRIRVERGRANLKRYGGKIQFTSQANYEGNQPIVRIPDSYAKRGRGHPRQTAGGAPARPKLQGRQPSAHRRGAGSPAAGAAPQDGGQAGAVRHQEIPRQPAQLQRKITPPSTERSFALRSVFLRDSVSFQGERNMI